VIFSTAVKAEWVRNSCSGELLVQGNDWTGGSQKDCILWCGTVSRLDDYNANLSGG
jgi:hypothetical protein